MSLRNLIDEVRETVIADDSLIASRPIIYTRKVDNVDITLNSYVGLGRFNEEEQNKLSDMQSFGGLKLEVAPKVSDAVEYDGEIYYVQRFSKQGTLYVVYCEKARQKGRR